MSSKTPKMRLSCVRSTAITYDLRVPEALGGWALCTVNDGTGELLITSDWGNWSYQWSPNPRHLGADSLTAFVGDRTSVHYLADKLGGGRGNRDNQDFDPEGTAKRLAGIVARKRLECGREAIELARDNEESVEEATSRLDRTQGGRFRPFEVALRSQRRFLTKDAARRIVESIESVAHDFYGARGSDAATLFIERFHRYVCDEHDVHDMFPEVWEDMVYEQKHSDKVLRESILPALIDACYQKTIERWLVLANGPQPSPEAV